MSTTVAVHPDVKSLVALLRRELPRGEESALTSHLEECPECQQRLEELATGGMKVVRALGDPQPAAPKAESRFWSAMQGLQHEPSTPARATTSPVTLPSAEVKDLGVDFLSPPDREGLIGKLGHFEVESVIGRGGMGIVLKAFDPCLQRPVAIKVMDNTLAGNEVAHQRFCREARAAASITHEHVVAVHQVDEDEKTQLPYLVMQLVQGESLDERLRRVGKLEPREIVRIGMQAAAGLAAAHEKGLIHRDIKPANILLETASDHVKLTDFGLARAAEDSKLTQTGLVAGTPLYMSPEQARGAEIDHRSDLFSLGTVLYEAATGKPPFEGSTPLAVLRNVTDTSHRPVRELNADIPDWLAAVIDGLLHKDPDERYQSAGAVALVLADRLGQLQPLSPLHLPALPPGSAASPPCHDVARQQRRRLITTAAAVGIIGLIAGLVLSGFSGASRFFMGPQANAENDPARRTPVAVLNANAGPIWSTAFSSDSKTLAMAIDDGTLKLWNVAERKVRATIDAHRGPIWSVAAASQGGLMATASDDGTVKLWDVETGKERGVLKHPGPVRAVAFSPDGRTLVSGNRDGGVRIWDVASGKESVTTRGHTGVIMDVAFSSDNRTIASASGDRTVKLWNAETGQELLTLQGHAGGVYAVTFSPDGKRVASGGWDKTVRVWDTATGSQLGTFQGHTQDIWAIAFCPQGTCILSGSEDRTVKVWDPETGAELISLNDHTGTIYTVAFSPDGSLLASGGRDGTVRLWSTRKE